MCEEHKISDFLHRMMSAGLGLIALSEEKAKSFIDDLVKRGEISAKEGEGILKGILDRLESTGKDMESRVSELVKKYIKREKIFTKADIDKLAERMEDIEKRLKAIEEKIKAQ